MSTYESTLSAIDTDKTNKINSHAAVRSTNDFNLFSFGADIILWRNPLRSAAVFMSCLTLEVSLICFSVISVLAYAGLALLAVATSLRLYIRFAGGVSSSSNSGNIIQSYMDKDITLANDSSSEMTHVFIGRLDQAVSKLRSLLLIEDYFESFKLAVFLYAMTYIGAKFNFMTLCISSTMIIFTIPKMYQIYQIEIDHIWRLIQNKLEEFFSSVQDKMSAMPVIGGFLRSHRE